MSTALRILFIEDSAADAELEEHELRQGGLVFTSRRVQTRRDLVAALAEFFPDIAISDYSLPDMDGLQALRIVHEAHPDLPFIFVSGTIGEERAIESLKNGATDYVVKDRLGPLVMKVRRALKEAEDRREHRRLEEQLRHAQRLESVGRLAGGIAHDFNNLLTVINGNAGLVMERLPDGDESREELGDVLRAGERAAALTRQLLAFSRQQVLRPAPVDVNDIVRDLERMLCRLIGDDIELVLEVATDDAVVMADSGQLEQVIVNLVVNARDAMPDGGRISIATACVLAPEDEPAGAHDIDASGAHVMLTVSDTGKGMDAETMSHAFEPFFTTKPKDQGSGLGLATVYGIIQQSGGAIRVRSECDKGTTFTIHLPRIDVTPAEAPSAAAPTPSVSGSETILVVEDSDDVRKLCWSILRRHGHDVLVAVNAEDALRVAATTEGVIHLLITDLVMPGMKAPDLIQRLATLRPGIKVLCMSGHVDPTAKATGLLESGTPFIQKPFGAADLLAKVREVLDRD